MIEAGMEATVESFASPLTHSISFHVLFMLAILLSATAIAIHEAFFSPSSFQPLIINYSEMSSVHVLSLGNLLTAQSN